MDTGDCAGFDGYYCFIAQDIESDSNDLIERGHVKSHQKEDLWRRVKKGAR